MVVDTTEMTPDEFRQLRRQLGLTQEQLARRLDVTLNTVQNWESGRRKIGGPIALLMRMLVERGNANRVQAEQGEVVPS